MLRTVIFRHDNLTIKDFKYLIVKYDYSNIRTKKDQLYL